MMFRAITLSILFASIFALPNFALNKAGVQRIRANDERLKYSGRFDHSDPLQPSFAWVMTGVSFTFETTSASTVTANFTAPSGKARIRVMVDGKLDGFVTLHKHSKGMLELTVANSIPAGAHVIELVKVTAALQATPLFAGDNQSRQTQLVGVIVPICRAHPRASCSTTMGVIMPQCHVPTSEPFPTFGHTRTCPHYTQNSQSHTDNRS